MQRKIMKPMIAAVNGLCMAQGCGLALSSDVIFASESAWFGSPQVKRGIGLVSGPSLLTRIVPLNIALEYLYTGKRLDSATALRWGIVNRVAPTVASSRWQRNLRPKSSRTLRSRFAR